MTKHANPKKLWNVLFNSGVITLFTRAEQSAAKPELIANRQRIKAVMPEGMKENQIIYQVHRLILALLTHPVGRVSTAA